MTLTFGLIAAALTVAVLAVLLYPLLKTRKTGSVGLDREKTLPIYRQQFAELEQDRVSATTSQIQIEDLGMKNEKAVLSGMIGGME